MSKRPDGARDGAVVGDRCLTYRGEVLRVRPAPLSPGRAAYQPDLPLYTLEDEQGIPRYTLWWAHGLPSSEHGRVMNIEEHVLGRRLHSAGFRTSELFVETEDGFSYVDNRGLIVISRMPPLCQAVADARASGQSFQEYATQQVDQALEAAALSLFREPEPDAARSHWINTVVGFLEYVVQQEERA